MAKATGSKEYSSREKLPLMQSGIDTRSGSGSVLGSGSDVTPRIARSWDNNDQPLVFSNTDNITQPSSTHLPLPRWKKLVYAVGSIPYPMCNTVVGFYLNIFLLEVAIISPVYVLIIVFSGRVWDAITDPFIGFLCTRTKTRWGRLRPWMISAAAPAGIVYALLWFVPPLGGSHEKFAYYICFYFAFETLLTCIHVPYTALTMHLSNDNKERDSATLYRICFEVCGTLLGILIFTGYFIGFVGSGSGDNCDSGERVPDLAERRAYRYHGITFAVLVVVFIATTFIGIREQKDEVRADKRIGFFSGLRETVFFRPYTYLLLLELFSWLAVQFVQGNLALYVKYSVGLESQYPYVIAVLLVATVGWMPFWQLVILKWGKKTAFTIGMWILMPMLLTLLFINYEPYVMYPLALIGGMGVSCAYLLPWSMLPDAIDEAYLHYGVRREELFYAFFVFGNKFASGVTLGVSTGILKAVGYDENKCDQPWTVALTLKLLVTAPPVIFILISLLFLQLYPIDEKRRQKTKELLEERRKSTHTTADGSPYTHRRDSISIPHWHEEREGGTARQSNL